VVPGLAMALDYKLQGNINQLHGLVAEVRLLLPTHMLFCLPL
jgi:hypothetical protein